MTICDINFIICSEQLGLETPRVFSFVEEPDPGFSSPKNVLLCKPVFTI